MPRKYLAEMVMDRRAACMTYQGSAYHPGAELEYLHKSRESKLMHPETFRQLEYILAMMQESGEDAAFRYIRQSVLKGKPFPWEQ